MAFPLVRSSISSSEQSNRQSHIVLLPPTIVAGDLIIVGFVCDKVGSPITWPDASWNVIYQHDTDAQVELAVAWRKADGSEGSSITITTGQSEKSCHFAYAIQNAADPVITPPEASSEGSGSSANPDPVGIFIGSAKDYLWIACGGNDNNGSANWISNPTDYTNNEQNADASSSGGCSAYAGTRQLNAITENPGAFTIAASEQWQAATIVVHPGAVGPTPDEVLTDLKAYLNRVDLTVLTDLKAYLQTVDNERFTDLKSYLQVVDIEVLTDLKSYLNRLDVTVLTDLKSYLEAGKTVHTDLKAILQLQGIEINTDLKAYIDALQTFTISTDLKGYLLKISEVLTDLKSHIKRVDIELSTDLKAYTYQAIEVFTDLKGYLRTVDNLVTGDLKGYLNTIDNLRLTDLKAYLYEAEEIFTDLKAYTSGTLGSLTDLKAYINQIGVLQYTDLKGYTVGAEQFPHVCVRASGREKFKSTGREKFRASEDRCPSERIIE